ncbi:sugar ABC transporter substrate-binding protein [Lachnoclostridium sp. An298]|uniref:ABC transporter substrate-binding protein n=1 Tax=Mediterraneibacter glycyrrhizinilyticus TaxID=342942 RepID=UPI000B38C979|nr:extracellular solute-binding protein [Mediterraneibacter glycyrrhizinilyticus]MDN0043458.1 extracellular solute-binding protein [Mediterraneibacter glycyrrhizinilyticus]OUO31278.1 sugar ABC transporter substrate-binding protein [Lachnoclostridium sp. An298]
MKKKKVISTVLAVSMLAAVILPGCGSDENSGKTEIEILQYKPEAATYFDQVEEQFNATHDDIHLTISSPNDASTIMRTRFIREDYPDIIGIGGDINYSYYVDADILADVSDYEGLSDVKQSYIDILENLEITPKDGTYGVPYVANAAGILYNKDMFEEHGWEIPESWSELIDLCEEIQAEGILPFYFGFRDTWTCLAPWNSLAVDLAPADTCQQVNAGETTFSEEYVEVAEKCLELVSYGPEDPFAYGYNDACTAFANGESAMYPIGSYAVPQILSVNPEMNIDSFVTPGNDDSSKNTLNSGVDLMFAVTAECENKEAAYEVLDFLMADENIQAYIDDQNAVPCKDGDFDLAPMLDGMTPFIESGNMTDYQDHYYPSEMAADALIQTYLINKDADAFLKDFDTRWQRYNRDIIRAVQEYNEEHGTAE